MLNFQGIQMRTSECAYSLVSVNSDEPDEYLNASEEGQYDIYIKNIDSVL